MTCLYWWPGAVTGLKPGLGILRIFRRTWLYKFRGSTFIKGSTKWRKVKQEGSKGHGPGPYLYRTWPHIKSNAVGVPHPHISPRLRLMSTPPFLHNGDSPRTGQWSVTCCMSAWPAVSTSVAYNWTHWSLQRTAPGLHALAATVSQLDTPSMSQSIKKQISQIYREPYVVIEREVTADIEPCLSVDRRSYTGKYTEHMLYYTGSQYFVTHTFLSPMS